MLPRWLLALVVLVLLPVAAAGDHTLPGGGPIPLRSALDPVLQGELEEMLRELGLAWPARKGRLAVALVDLADPHAPRVAAVNGDRMLYAASLPKIAILLGAFVQIERGRMRLDYPTQLDLEQMIRFSSNPAATRVLVRVGRKDLIDILRSERFRLYDEINGGLWVGKDYSKRPAYRRDPLHHLSHGATALQTARFYYLLETGYLLEPELTRKMKAILSNPGIRHKFVKGLEDYDVSMYRKSGTWKQWHADSALVKTRHETYILVGLVEDARGGKWLERIAHGAHRLVVPVHYAARY